MNTVRTWNDLLNLFSKGRYRVRANGQNHVVDFDIKAMSLDTPGISPDFKTLNHQQLQTKLETLQISPLCAHKTNPQDPIIHFTRSEGY